MDPTPTSRTPTPREGPGAGPPIHDLRSALRRLEGVPGQLLRTRTQVDPNAELAGVYRYVGAGGTVARPTRIGPAMLFENVKGFPSASRPRLRPSASTSCRLPARSAAGPSSWPAA